MMFEDFNTRWKIWNEAWRWLAYPFVRFLFAINRIEWGKDWRLHGLPIIQKHRQSTMHFGKGLKLRSTVQSNPIGPYHPVILCTWEDGALLEIGDDFGMAGGSIVTAERISIGNHVRAGANCTIMDTDFHPLDPEQRRFHPQDAKPSPISIEDDVFIGMNCIILKGVTIGRGSVIGAGSVVTKEIPPGVIVAGNPAKVIRHINDMISSAKSP